MKIDFDMLKKLADAGATAHVVIAMLEEQHARGHAKRAKDKTAAANRRATKRDAKRQPATPSDSARQAATLDDTPRARLFREGTPALMTLGRTDRAARSLIGGWLKQTHDDDQLVLATILRARDLAVADAAGWITATLKGNANGKTARPNRPSLADAANDLVARAEQFDGKGDVGQGDYIDGSLEEGAGPRRAVV